VPQIDSGWSVVTKLSAVGDFDGDGVPDLLGVEGTGLYLFRGDGTGTFYQDGGTRINSTWNWGASAFQEIIPVGDFNTDGYPDLLVRSVNAGVTNLDLFVSGPPTSYGGPPTLHPYSDRSDCLSGSQAHFPPRSPPWAATLPPAQTKPMGNADLHPNCICTMGVVSGAGYSPVCHLDAGSSRWSAFSRFIPVGNLGGDSPALPGFVAVGQATPVAIGGLYLFKGWGDGSIQNQNAWLSGGWNSFDAILGVW
jgi:hypothetical protein